MQHCPSLHMCAFTHIKNAVDASTVSLISLEGTFEWILTYTSYNEWEEIPNWKLVEFHFKPICTAIITVNAISIVYNHRRDIIVSATKVRLQYRILLILQFSDKIVASPNTTCSLSPPTLRCHTHTHPSTCNTSAYRKEYTATVHIYSSMLPLCIIDICIDIESPFNEANITRSRF